MIKLKDIAIYKREISKKLKNNLLINKLFCLNPNKLLVLSHTMLVNTYEAKKFLRLLEIDIKFNINGVPTEDFADHFTNFLKESSYGVEGKLICRKIRSMANNDTTCTDLINLFKSEHRPAYYKFFVYATYPEDKFESIKFLKNNFDIDRDVLINNSNHFLCHKRLINVKLGSEVTDLIQQVFTSYFLDTLGCFLYSMKQLYNKNPLHNVSIERLTHREYQRAAEHIAKILFSGEKFLIDEIADDYDIIRSPEMDKALKNMYYAKKKIKKQIMLNDNDMYNEHCNANLTYATKLGGYTNVKLTNARVKKLLNSYLFYYLELCLPPEHHYNVSDSLKLPIIENLDMTPVCIEI